MQAVKDKFNDMKAMREAKAEAKAEEHEQKELAKARVEIAKEVRKAKEAEAAMDLHVAKAGEKAEREIAKHVETHPNINHENMMNPEPALDKHHHFDHNTSGNTGGAPPMQGLVEPQYQTHPTSNKYL